MSETLARPYWIEPAALGRIGSALKHAAATSATMSEVCEAMTPLMAACVEIEGIENIPSEGPLIAIKNHPFHLDALVLGGLFAARPEMRYLVKSTPLTGNLPEESQLSLRKNGPHANIEDVKALQTYLDDGGSLLAAPWGSLDHEAKSYATLERTVQNSLRYASFSDAHILPIEIDVTWGQDGQLPVPYVKASFKEPVLAKEGGLDEASIRAAASNLYERFAA